MVPRRLGLGHPVNPVGLVVVHSAIVAECGTADDVEDDEDDEDDDVDDGDLPPALLDAGQHPGLAGVAVVAERALIIAPFHAVRVDQHGPAGAHVPHRLVHVRETARRRRLAATRLPPIHS